jgi:TrmH family RNA methyltransferase
LPINIFNGDVITSRQNSAVVAACKLSEKKHRDSEKRFRIDGIKLFEEAVMSDVDIDTVFVKESARQRIGDRIKGALEKLQNTDVKVLSDGVFDKISEEKSPEGILCFAKYIDKLHKNATINTEDDFLRSGAKIFAVESVRDPGNLGTVIRTSAAFGVDFLVVSSDCADIYNPKTVRAAMGALFRQKIIRVPSMPEAVKALSESGRTVYAATLGKAAALLGSFELNKTDCIVVGNEGHGLSEETVSACDRNILIPMVEGAESLNAAVASSVCIWEQFGKILNS